MRLATLADGGRDGRLAVVSHDGRRCARTGAAPTLQDALERWQEVEPALRQLAAGLDGPEGGGASGEAFDESACLAPLPRAWQWLDGSAFTTHGRLMQTAFNMPPIETSSPLMYQGLSDRFLAPREDVPLPSEDDGIDFEGEFAVVTGAVPIGSSPERTKAAIRLVLLVNDWSLRVLAPLEMKTGFGWVQAKPACSAAPLAVTPDELGEQWRDGRVALPLSVFRGEERFGAPSGAAMAYSFPELIAHAARTRALPAGTIVGSGTVSNDSYAEVGSCCISERRAIEMIAHGRPRTDFLRFGERVRMECRDPSGRSLFGALDQKVVQVPNPDSCRAPEKKMEATG